MYKFFWVVRWKSIIINGYTYAIFCFICFHSQTLLSKHEPHNEQRERKKFEEKKKWNKTIIVYSIRYGNFANEMKINFSKICWYVCHVKRTDRTVYEIVERSIQLNETLNTNQLNTAHIILLISCVLEHSLSLRLIIHEELILVHVYECMYARVRVCAMVIASMWAFSTFKTEHWILNTECWTPNDEHPTVYVRCDSSRCL